MTLSLARRVRGPGANIDAEVAASSLFTPLGVSPWKSNTLPLIIGVCRSATLSLPRRVRGPRAGVDVEATTPDFTFVVVCRLWPLGWQGRRPHKERSWN
jgi:hypothetical protein